MAKGRLAAAAPAGHCQPLGLHWHQGWAERSLRPLRQGQRRARQPVQLGRPPLGRTLCCCCPEILGRFWTRSSTLSLGSANDVAARSVGRSSVPVLLRSGGHTRSCSLATPQLCTPSSLAGGVGSLQGYSREGRRRSGKKWGSRQQYRRAVCAGAACGRGAPRVAAQPDWAEADAGPPLPLPELSAGLAGQQRGWPGGRGLLGGRRPGPGPGVGPRKQTQHPVWGGACPRAAPGLRCISRGSPQSPPALWEAAALAVRPAPSCSGSCAVFPGAPSVSWAPWGSSVVEPLPLAHQPSLRPGLTVTRTVYLLEVQASPTGSKGLTQVRNTFLVRTDGPPPHSPGTVDVSWTRTAVNSQILDFSAKHASGPGVRPRAATRWRQGATTAPAGWTS